MKKVFLLFTTMMLIVSCSGLQKENKEYRHAIDGRWVVDDVTYEGPEGNFKVDAFGEGKPECFIGSIWALNQNNSSGTYTLPGGADCNSGTKAINWSVYESGSNLNYFQYKVLGGNKAKKVASGYRMGVDMVSGNEMKLRSTVKIDGESENYNIIYHFKRSNP